MIRQNDRNFAFAELADTAVTKNPITGKSYRDEALTDAEISFGNRYNPGNPVNFAQIINEYRYRLGGLLKLINNTGILPYNAEISYSVGAIVTKNQNIFTSLINGNINNNPESSPAAWESIVDFLADEFVRVDLSNVTTSGSGQTIVLQDSADLLNPTCTTQPAGTSNTLAASTEFVQNAVAEKSNTTNVVINAPASVNALDVIDIGPNEILVRGFVTGQITYVPPGKWQHRGQIGGSILLGRYNE